MMSDAPFRLLLVCTGNVCRSPTAAQLFAAAIGRRLADPAAPSWGSTGSAFGLASAGTHALVGDPMPEEAAAVSRSLGGDPGAHRARQVSAPLVESADLVLTMARAHRSEVVSLVPRASRYSFTLRQFARLAAAAADSPERPEPGEVAGRMRQAVALAAARRGYAEPFDPAESEDILDPYGQEPEVYERSGRQIADEVQGIMTAFDRILEGASS